MIAFRPKREHTTNKTCLTREGHDRARLGIGGNDNKSFAAGQESIIEIEDV